MDHRKWTQMATVVFQKLKSVVGQAETLVNGLEISAYKTIVSNSDI